MTTGIRPDHHVSDLVVVQADGAFGADGVVLEELDAIDNGGGFAGFQIVRCFLCCNKVGLFQGLRVGMCERVSDLPGRCETEW